MSSLPQKLLFEKVELTEEESEQSGARTRKAPVSPGQQRRDATRLLPATPRRVHLRDAPTNTVKHALASYIHPRNNPH